MASIESLQGVARVTRAGSTVLEVAGGVADAEAGLMCTPQTRFQIASVSKQFTATAMMMLVDDGAIALTDPVQRWLPEVPPRWHSITVHHLLSHTSGMRHWHDPPGFQPFEPMSTKQRLELFAEAPLDGEPGAAWHYSSPGYMVVGAIVTQASGMPYAEFVRERILDPLSLTSTTIGEPPAGANTARGYRDGVPLASFDLSTMTGTGDVVCTVGDLTRFTTALQAGELVSAPGVELMCTPHAPLTAGALGDDDWAGDPGYGYGHYIADLRGEPLVFHLGDNPGYLAFNAWLPRHDAAIAVLINDEAVDLDPIIKELLAVATGS